MPWLFHLWNGKWAIEKGKLLSCSFFSFLKNSSTILTAFTLFIKLLHFYTFLLTLRNGGVCVLSPLQSNPTLGDPMDCSLPGFSVQWNSLGKITGGGFHALLWGIFPTQRLNLHLMSPAVVGRFFTTRTTW